ncbi:hypothetical protein PoB_004124600 [Plakobranchus ocellatus]|uniref:Uncharacterized protein n=1 Tax=Plakobranchus ocellatus TaxID=259542 RepID=A0AAV4AUI3_9GAST|nr:hypothetical protein PoB_004124600 [Plakobranchus ocellatus]
MENCFRPDWKSNLGPLTGDQLPGEPPFLLTLSSDVNIPHSSNEATKTLCLKSGGCSGCPSQLDQARQYCRLTFHRVDVDNKE